ncbi:hypothetical protein GYMLUDRAFT_82836 [Collybiopsis luxurians FD-317 M1]|nr:hypothetical protein GYMLUDRAFT_82836 [Collybiopsis luxurians FD-317 M1]
MPSKQAERANEDPAPDPGFLLDIEHDSESDYNSNGFESDFADTSESEKEEWQNDAEITDKDWPVDIVGVEVGKADKIYYEAHWQNWTREDGTSNTYHRKGDNNSSIKGVTKPWDTAWKDQIIEPIRQKLRNEDATALEVELWSDDDVLSTATRNYMQAFPEKLSQVGWVTRKNKRLQVVYSDLGKGLRRRGKELFSERMGENAAKALFPGDSEREDSDTDDDPEQDDDDHSMDASSSGRRRTRSETSRNRALSRETSTLTLDRPLSHSQSSNSFGLTRGARKSTQSRLPLARTALVKPSSSSTLSSAFPRIQKEIVSPSLPANFKHASSSSVSGLVAKSSSTRRASIAPQTSSPSSSKFPPTSMAFTSKYNSSTLTFNNSVTMLSEPRRLRSLPRRAMSTESQSFHSVASTLSESHSTAFYTVPTHASGSQPGLLGKRKLGKGKERAKSRIELLSEAWTAAAAEAGAAPVTFANDVDDEDGPPGVGSERFIYLEAERFTRVPSILDSPDPDLFLRCECAADTLDQSDHNMDMDVDTDGEDEMNFLSTPNTDPDAASTSSKAKAKAHPKGKGKEKAYARFGHEHESETMRMMCGLSCECQSISELRDKRGRLLRAYSNDGLFRFTSRTKTTATGVEIVECNQYCSCSVSHCFNRVAQRPRTIPIEIFKTAEQNSGRGWGARCSDRDIKRGTVLGCYTGEIIHRSKAARLLGDQKTYVFDLDSRDHELVEEEEDLDDSVRMYSINARKCGNWTRFLNHSCFPNVAVYTAVWDTIPEQNIPQLVFFALEDIPQGTELTVDYHAGVELPENGKPILALNEIQSTKGKSKQKGDGSEGMRPWGTRECFCGAKWCRGWV